MSKLKISFVIPCYRSEKTIETVVSELISTVNQRDNVEYEVILVNDSSPDNVIEVLRRMSSINERIKVINFSRNYGRASAVLAGLGKANGDFIISLDDDGQCPGNRLWELIDALDNADVAYADYPVKKESCLKRFGSMVNTKAMNYMIEQPDNIRPNNMVAIKKFVAEEMIKYKNPYPALHPLIMQITHSVAMVPMEERNRADDNASGFTIIKSIRHMIDSWTSFSIKPLRLSVFVGFLITIAGFIYGIILVIQKICFEYLNDGYASIMVLILFIGGINMMLLGIVGEYLGRLYLCVNNTPQYSIKETINL